MAISRADKVKRMMGNFVGASASVAVVTAVASFTISVQASFLDVTVFQNRAFYQLQVQEIVTVDSSGELPEDVPAPVNTPVRLRVQNQWDDFSLPLIYGYNEGFIEPLRANQSYTLTIELQQAIGWSSLDTFTFNTAPARAAVIASVTEFTSPLNPLIDLEITVLTQDGATPTEAWTLAMTYGETVTSQPLNLGENLIAFNDLPHVNAPIELAVIALLPTGETTVTSRQFSPTEFVDASIEFAFSDLTTLAIATRLDVSFLNAQYHIRLKTANGVTMNYPLSDANLLIPNLTQGLAYQLEWVMTYAVNQGQKEVILLTKSIRPIATPIYVLSIIETTQGMELTLTIDSDLSLAEVTWQGTVNDVFITLPFTLMTESESAFTYTLSTDFLFEANSTWRLVITQPAPDDVPITLQTIVFQGGNTI